jgi:hypothetical protein
MVNAQALTETLAVVEKQVENGTGRFNQGAWAEETPCGTAGCFAGWRAFLDGYTFLEEGERLVNRTTGESLALWPWGEDEAGGEDEAECEAGDTVAEHATRRFGLNRGQADSLFSGRNTLNDLRRKVAALIASDEKSAAR